MIRQAFSINMLFYIFNFKQESGTNNLTETLQVTFRGFLDIFQIFILVSNIPQTFRNIRMILSVKQLLPNLLKRKEKKI